MARRPEWLSTRRILVGLLLLTCLLLLTALVRLPSILQALLNQQAPAILYSLTGIRLQLDVRQLDWQHLYLHQASADLPDGTHLEVEALTLNFPSLLPGDHTGQSRDLDIHRLLIQPADASSQLALTGARQAGRDAEAALANTVTLPRLSDWLQLPIHTVQIEQLQIRHPLLKADLSTSLSQQLWRLHGDIHLTGVTTPWQLELQLQQSGQLLLQIADQQTLLSQLYAHIKQDEHNTRIELSHQTGLADLYQRLLQTPPVWLPIPANLPLIASQLDGNATLEMPNQARLPEDLTLHSTLNLQTLTAELQPGTQIQASRFQLTTEHLSGGDWQWQLRNPLLDIQQADQRITLHDLQLSAHCLPGLDQCELQQQGPIELSSSGQQLTLQTAINGHWQTDHLLLNSTPVFTGKHALGTFKGSSQIQLDWRPQHTRIDISTLSANWKPSATFRQTSGGWQAGELKLALQQPVHFTLVPNPQSGWHMQGEPLNISTEPLLISKGKSRLQLGASSLICNPDLHLPDCQLDIRLRASRLEQWPVPDARLRGTLSFNPDQQQLDADLQLQAAQQQLQLRGHIRHHLDSGEGSAQWHLDQLHLNWAAMGLGEVENLTGLQLLAGNLNGQGWIDWNLGTGYFQPDLMLRGDNISLIYNNSISADHWNFLLALQRPSGKPKGDFQINAQFAGASVDTGVALTDLLARAQISLAHDFSWYSADLQEVHTDILGGRIHIPAAHYDSRKDTNAFGIDISNLQLAQVAALEPGAEINATGTMDGTIPVVITAQGPSVPDGSLFARSPGGVIRYHNDTSISLKNTDPTLAIAMQALENFHFHELSSGINYEPDGSLHLAMKFQGNNPDFFGGQSTNLNINLEYNLLDLLESLRVADDIINRMEKQYGQ
jgi:hypothetical protein